MPLIDSIFPLLTYHVHFPATGSSPAIPKLKAVTVPPPLVLLDAK